MEEMAACLTCALLRPVLVGGSCGGGEGRLSQLRLVVAAGELVGVIASVVCAEDRSVDIIVAESEQVRHEALLGHADFQGELMLAVALFLLFLA